MPTCCRVAPSAAAIRSGSSRRDIDILWANIPTAYREQATFYTDQYEAYTCVIPAAQHKAMTKKARKTNHIERFNNTLGQRVSRLMRDTLAFQET
jgi:insertion element IS1 protein InsB